MLVNGSMFLEFKGVNLVCVCVCVCVVNSTGSLGSYCGVASA
jgi:hypothetical protein